MEEWQKRGGLSATAVIKSLSLSSTAIIMRARTPRLGLACFLCLIVPTHSNPTIRDSLDLRPPPFKQRRLLFWESHFKYWRPL